MKIYVLAIIMHEENRAFTLMGTFYVDLDQVYMVLAAKAGQRKWRQIRIPLTKAEATSNTYVFPRYRLPGTCGRVFWRPSWCLHSDAPPKRKYRRSDPLRSCWHNQSQSPWAPIQTWPVFRVCRKHERPTRAEGNFRGPRSGANSNGHYTRASGKLGQNECDRGAWDRLEGPLQVQLVFLHFTQALYNIMAISRATERVPKVPMKWKPAPIVNLNIVFFFKSFIDHVNQNSCLRNAVK